MPKNAGKWRFPALSVYNFDTFTWGKFVEFPFCLELTHSPLKILPNSKTRFEASRAVFWSLSRYKELKLTIKPFTGRSLRGLLIQMQNISLRSSGMRRKQNFEISLYFSSHLFSLFLSRFFSSCWVFGIGFILVGKVVRKAFRILGLDERKGRCVVEQDFHGNFQVNVTWFFCLFPRCPWLNCAHSGMV